MIARRRHRGHYTAATIARWRLAQLREHFRATGQAERLAWLERIATGQLAPGSEEELAELHEALGRVIAVIQGQ